MIPLVDVQAQYGVVGNGIEAKVLDVLRSGRYVKGPWTPSLEEQFSDFIGEGVHTVAVSSGTTALELALRAHDIGPGDRVAVPALTFFATVEAVINVGAEPVLVDVDQHGNLSVEDLKRVGSINAMIVVHLYGRPAPMDDISAWADSRGVLVIEDCAQAHGGKYSHRRKIGCYGNTCAWSFYPAKNLGGVADGGAVTTDDEDLAERLRGLRDHGRRGGKYVHHEVGTNARMSEIQAAALSAKMLFLPNWQRKRTRAARRYRKLIGLDEVTRREEVVRTPDPHIGHAWHLYVIRLGDGVSRDAVKAKMKDRGVGVGVHYPIALPDQPALANDIEVKMFDAYPNARAIAEDCLSLPLYPEIDMRTQSKISLALRVAVREAMQ